MAPTGKGRQPSTAPAPPELHLQVVERHFEFRECNYTLYPSRMAYPWPHAHLRLSGGAPVALERYERRPGRADEDANTQLVYSYAELDDAAALNAALLDFAVAAPQPAKALLDLNPGTETRSVSGQLFLFGRRIASLSRGGELRTLPGLRFSPELELDKAAADGERGRILIHPGTRTEFVLPAVLARRTQQQSRLGIRVENIEVLPSVFVDFSAFRRLWPDLPAPQVGTRYRLTSETSEAAVQQGRVADKLLVPFPSNSRQGSARVTRCDDPPCHIPI